MTTPILYAKCKAILDCLDKASEFPHTFTPVPVDGDNFCKAIEAGEPYGFGMWFDHDPYADRLSIHVNPGNLTGIDYDSRTRSVTRAINVSFRRDPKAIAADVARRLLAVYMMIREVLVERADQDRLRSDVTAKTAALIESTITHDSGIEVYLVKEDKQADWRIGTRMTALPYSVSGTINPDRVNLSLAGLTPLQAALILRIVTEQDEYQLTDFAESLGVLHGG